MSPDAGAQSIRSGQMRARMGMSQDNPCSGSIQLDGKKAEEAGAVEVERFLELPLQTLQSRHLGSLRVQGMGTAMAQVLDLSRASGRVLVEEVVRPHQAETPARATVNRQSSVGCWVETQFHACSTCVCLNPSQSSSQDRPCLITTSAWK